MRLGGQSLLLLAKRSRKRIERPVGKVRGARGSNHNLLQREQER